jgi:hypothetical protein
LSILSNTTVIGGCGLRSGNLTTTRSMFVKFSPVLGHNFQFKVSGKEIQQVDHTQHLMLLKKRKKN